MNFPRPGASSAFLRTASHSVGTSCHSSINRGSSPLSARDGSSRASSMDAGAAGSSRQDDAACCKAVVVFPEARGPMRLTAGATCKSSVSC